MNNYKTIFEIGDAVKNKKVALRIDANVPIVNGKITDDSRIKESLPSINFLLKQGVGQIFILSHFGRPKTRDQSTSLINIKPRLEELLKQEVEFCEIEEIENAKAQVVLCENLRYNKGEEAGEEDFAKKLAQNVDFYVNDAFSCSHRPHASISVVAKFVPVYAGILMLKEIESIESIVSRETKNVFAIVGGSKVSTKLALLKNLAPKMKYIFISGGMANTFLHAKGFNIGASLCEKDLKESALEILKLASECKCQIILPEDVFVCQDIKNPLECHMVSVKDVRDEDIIVDAGFETIKSIEVLLQTCDILTWNGPLGIFETPRFATSTFMLARIVAKLTKEGKIKSIIGGGDTGSAILEAGLKQDMTYVSTAGGAFLEWLEGKDLPGIEALKV